MREGWKCPQCGKIMSPDVTEHTCGQVAAPYRPDPIRDWPFNPLQLPPDGWKPRAGAHGGHS